jgi:hypothetical protein
VPNEPRIIIFLMFSSLLCEVHDMPRVVERQAKASLRPTEPSQQVHQRKKATRPQQAGRTMKPSASTLCEY